MAKIQNELKTVLKTLANLSKKVEKLIGQTDQVKKAAPAKKAAPKKAAAKKAEAKEAPAKKAPAKKAAPKKAPKKEAAPAGTVIDTILNAVKSSKSGIKIAELKTKTGIGGRQLSNALYKLTKRNLIKTTDRGVYTAI